MKAHHAAHCLALFALAGLASGIGQHLPGPDQPPQWGWRKAGDGWPSMRSPAEAALALTPSGMPVVAFQGSVMGNDNICQVRKVYDSAWRGVGGNVSNCHTLSLAAERTGGVVLSYYDTAAGCPSVKRWTAAAGWSAVGGCAGGRNWPGASSVALASDSSPVLVYYIDWDRPTELGSIAFQKINETRSQTSGRLFPSWSFSAGSGLAVLPAGNGWPEVAVVLAHGRRKKVPRKSAEAGVYLLAYSWTTGKSWKQLLVAGEDPPSMALARSGPGLVAAVQNKGSSKVQVWRVEPSTSFPVFQYDDLPSGVLPRPPMGNVPSKPDELGLAVGGGGTIYLASTDSRHNTIDVLKYDHNYWQLVGGPLKTAGKLHLAGLAVAPSSSQPYITAINDPAGGGGLRVWQFSPAD